MKKVFIDSNIVIRLFVKDQEGQLLIAKQVIQDVEEQKLQGILSILVINEIIWILEHYYELRRKDYIPSLLKLLSMKNIKIYEVKKEITIHTLQMMLKRNIDFTDLYLLEITHGQKIASFDKDIGPLTS